MHLTVLKSGSSGNGYILETDNEALILECGVPFMAVKKALNFDLSTVVGCLCTHVHQDHFGKAKELISAGIDIFTSQGTITASGLTSHRLIPVEHGERFKIGSFIIMPLRVEHDAPESLCFLIRHPECGDTLFATDTQYIPYKFKGLTNLLIEANYDDDIISERLAEGANKSVRDRVLFSHMSLTTLLQFLEVNDNKTLNNIVLLHLSDGNSNARDFKSRVEAVVPGKQVWIADKGLKINLDQHPF